MHVFKAGLFAGKTVFVTGGGSGICKEIAKGYMQLGANTVLMGRRENVIADAKAELEAATGAKSLACQGDVRDQVSVESCVKAAVSEFGGIDILINGAAGNFLAPTSKLSFNAFNTVTSIDTVGTWNVTKAVYEHAMRGHSGVIINIVARLYGVVMQSHAASAKAAVEALTACHAVEYGPHNVRVNAIAPGAISGTEGFDKLAANSDAAELLKKWTPAQRWGDKEDIANAAIFLASDAASYITGHTLVVSGGQELTNINFPMLDSNVLEAWSKGKLN